jgi:TRAP-type C4-dicarboxylate transport system permease small subunit
VLALWRRRYGRLLESIVIVLMALLAVEVTVGVVFRYVGYSLVWYDEVASIGLAWVTYYGAALAALKRSHIGVPELVRMLPPGLRVPLAVFAEAIVLAFFVVLAWVGYEVLEVLASDTLVSLPAVSVAYAQSVIPIGSVLFIIAQVFALPEVLREAREA